MRGIAAAVFAMTIGLLPTAGYTDTIEKPDVTLAVGGKSGLYYLPLTVTERLGLF
jgi:NitT/TauT family transport system substrate-binding protein